MPRVVRVRVPATSANLGPAFDCAGLALALYDVVTVELTGGGLDVQVTGQGAAELPLSEEHLVVRSLRTAFDRLGGQPAGLAVRCTNAIPQARGLGSSSAAICAALVAARALVGGGLDDDALLALADRIEGHPDNVAACLRGGLTLAWSDDGSAHVTRVTPDPDLVAVALVPPTRASTAQVRGLLPALVPHADAAAAAGRAALLALAIAGRGQLLLPATRDWLHQAYRAPAMAPSADLVAALRQDGVAAFISGAGPTVLALLPRADAAAVAARAPQGWIAHVLAVDLDGAVVLPPD